MTQPDSRPGNLLALVWKLLQLWTKCPQNWKRNLFLSIVAILSTLYGIGSIPLPDSGPDVKPQPQPSASVQPQPQPPVSVDRTGHCNQIFIGSGNINHNSPNCPTSNQSFHGGVSVNSFHAGGMTSFHAGGMTSLDVYNLLLSPTVKGSASAAAPLISPVTGGTALTVNPIAPQSAATVLLPIAIGFYRTEKIAGQVGGRFYTGAASVGGKIVAGAKQVKRWVAQIGEPGRSESGKSAPRSCSA